jgi:RNA recognition motif 2
MDMGRMGDMTFIRAPSHSFLRVPPRMLLNISFPDQHMVVLLSGLLLHTHLPSQRASPLATQNHLKYRSAPSHEPSEQQMDNNLNIARIENGQDMRTMVMIKNTPNKMTDKDLMTFIERVCAGHIDFFYLRMDFKNGMHSTLASDLANGEPGCNVGYAFVKFITVNDLLRSLRRRDSVSDGGFLGFYEVSR